MTPVQGVVVGLKRGSMEIRLESRSTITTKRVEGIGRGDAVEVAYDFTHNRVEAIWLIHLSDDNSDAERFRREIMAATGKPVYVAGEKEE